MTSADTVDRITAILASARSRREDAGQCAKCGEASGEAPGGNVVDIRFGKRTRASGRIARIVLAVHFDSKARLEPLTAAQIEDLQSQLAEHFTALDEPSAMSGAAT